MEDHHVPYSGQFDLNWSDQIQEYIQRLSLLSSNTQPDLSIINGLVNLANQYRISDRNLAERLLCQCQSSLVLYLTIISRLESDFTDAILHALLGNDDDQRARDLLPLFQGEYIWTVHDAFRRLSPDQLSKCLWFCPHLYNVYALEHLPLIPDRIIALFTLPKNDYFPAQYLFDRICNANSCQVDIIDDLVKLAESGLCSEYDLDNSVDNACRYLIHRCIGKNEAVVRQGRRLLLSFAGKSSQRILQIIVELMRVPESQDALHYIYNCVRYFPRCSIGYIIASPSFMSEFNPDTINSALNNLIHLIPSSPGTDSDMIWPILIDLVGYDHDKLQINSLSVLRDHLPVPSIAVLNWPLCFSLITIWGSIIASLNEDQKFTVLNMIRDVVVKLSIASDTCLLSQSLILDQITSHSHDDVNDDGIQQSLHIDMLKSLLVVGGVQDPSRLETLGVLIQRHFGGLHAPNPIEMKTFLKSPLQPFDHRVNQLFSRTPSLFEVISLVGHIGPVVAIAKSLLLCLIRSFNCPSVPPHTIFFSQRAIAMLRSLSGGLPTVLTHIDICPMLGLIHSSETVAILARVLEHLIAPNPYIADMMADEIERISLNNIFHPSIAHIYSQIIELNESTTTSELMPSSSTVMSDSTTISSQT
uniref:Uncharacterized protein n=1 Tax=Spongospora subterranea TaxID=70186 RepID=A0A0H5R690_9EUKA|eukprot:CRZ09653.1 hypothetical protein [Spongospora subterranea]